MLVTKVEVFLLANRFTFVKVSTDEGVSGWGTAVFHGGAITADVTRKVAAAVIGRDPFQTEAIWYDLFVHNYRAGSTGANVAAISALDIAFHDVKGRALGVPVYSLLGGGVRQRVSVYASLMRMERTPEQEANEVLKRVSGGYKSVKIHTASPWALDAGPDDTAETVKAIRRQCGDDVRLLVDVNQAFTVPTALRVGRVLESLGVSHFEEPLPPWDLRGYDQLQAALDIAVAAGEQEHNLWQFRDLIVRGHLDIIQPNVTACGGFTAAMKIAALAETYNTPIVGHNTEPTLMTAANLQFWAAARMCRDSQEYFAETLHPLRDVTPVLSRPLIVKGGEIEIPKGPGLGVEVDEEIVRKVSATSVIEH